MVPFSMDLSPWRFTSYAGAFRAHKLKYILSSDLFSLRASISQTPWSFIECKNIFDVTVEDSGDSDCQRERWCVGACFHGNNRLTSNANGIG